jgi:hypothetical protein
MSWQNEIDKPKASFLSKLFLWGAGLLIVLGLLILLFGIPGRFVGREAQKFDAETSRQVYDESRTYQQGMQRELTRLCTEWRSQPEGSPAKSALLNEYVSELSSYTGPQTALVQKCSSEMGVQ